MGWFALKDYDMFGHQVQMNYNREMDTYNTKCGGCMSFCIKLMMLIMVIEKFRIMWYLLDDNIVKSSHSIDLVEAGELDYRATNMNMFWAVRNYVGGLE